MKRLPPLRYFLYVLPTIWVILAAVMLLGSLAFSAMGLAVVLPVLIVGTVAGIVAVFTQM
jgi:hypothetical protein